MKKLPLLALLLVVLAACKLDPVDDRWEYYKEWREESEAWLKAMTDSTNEDGTPYFHKVISEYDKNAYVLMHYFNDRNETANNLRPLATSVVDVKYYLRLHNGTAADSSYLSTTPADSVVRFDLGGSLIDGYRVALMDMHVGDSVDVIVPFQSGYGVSGSGSILPYSNLKFSIKLVDIYEYEKQ